MGKNIGYFAPCMGKNIGFFAPCMGKNIGYFALWIDNYKLSITFPKRVIAKAVA